MRKILLISFILFVCIGFGVYAGGQPEVPSIPPATSGTQYLSPNGDGVKDQATIDFTVTVYVKSKEGYVPEYGLEIKDNQGNILKQIVETEDRDIGWLRSLFTGYKKFELQRSVTWDGKNTEGEVVEDGTYSLSLWVEGPDGKRQTQQLDNFVVDTQPPKAVIVEPESMIFSPNGDGHKDTITITHTKATSEVEWTGEIKNSEGEVVKTYTWENSTPGEVVWDGTDDEGNALPEGTYTYVLSSEDRAGNESEDITLEGIELDRTDTPIEVVIEPEYFSPNGDGEQDQAVAYLDQAVKEEIIGWSWKVVNERGETVNQGQGEGDVPPEIVLEGMDDDGQPLPEGSYRFSYSVTYRNGNRPVANEEFELDVTPPEIEVTIDNPVFSPDEDGRKDRTSVQFKSDEKVTWEGSIVDPDGREIMSSDSERSTSLIVWDGSNEAGEKVEDGSYLLLATFTDRAGNTTDIVPKTVKVDTEPVDVKIAAELKGFSPNNDGRNDRMPLQIDASQYDDVQRWTVAITAQGQDVRRVFSGEGELPEELNWDGNLSQQENMDTRSAPEGRYSAEIDVEYMKGKSAESSTDSFVLDVTPPRVDVRVAQDPFARTNGSIEGEVFITVNVEEETEVTDWSMDIVDKDGDIIRTYNGDGDPSGDITWNAGSQEDREKLDTEMFTLNLKVSDAGGNVRDYTQQVPLDVFLVKRNGKLHIAVPNIIFGAYQHELDSRSEEMHQRNIESIERVINIYERYPENDLLLEGHALNIYRGVDAEKEAEEEEILVPLTRRRATTVNDALVERGLDAEKIEIEYFGGRMPIVSVHDREERWKNRRVEFIMKKKDSSE
ncbi:MAG: gliding motility-associated C-terminal domain-containing protein [Spirochaetota bacterium]